MTEPLRILLSAQGRGPLLEAIAAKLGARPYRFVDIGEDADIAFVTRDVTAMSTKQHVFPETQAFYDTLLAAPSLRWVHVHSAGADRPIYLALKERGVVVTTSSGANAMNVTQTVLAGMFSLARRFPEFAVAQRERRWIPFRIDAPPRDLQGQTATIVGWGPIGQHVARVLSGFGLRIVVVRLSDVPAEGAALTVPYTRLREVLPDTDWLILACPLSPETDGLVDAAELSLLRSTAHLVNVARGEVVREAALIDALVGKRVAGAYLDVFEREPLPSASPLWDLPGVIITPHIGGHSDGNAKRNRAIFLGNLACWLAGEPLANVA